MEQGKSGIVAIVVSFEIDMTYYQKVTHGEDCFCVGDTVELCASGRQPPLSGDYKVRFSAFSLHW